VLEVSVRPKRVLKHYAKPKIAFGNSSQARMHAVDDQCLLGVKLGPRAASKPGPLIPQQRTCRDCIGMSVSCHSTKSLRDSPRR
jgi:hypothetical protein